jgi:plasmid stabilization system protein ParE
MTRASLTYTRQAVADLNDIVRELGWRASPSVAARWKAKLRRKAALLRDHPMIGTRVDEFGDGRRRLVEAPYLIFYEVPSPGRVVVVRVLDGRRDLPRLFGVAND